MAKKSGNNFNAMRPAFKAAWKSGNRKPINKDVVDALDIDNGYFIMWQADVHKLQLTVEDYVDKAFNGKFNKEITEGDIYAARERIFPKWKELLHCAESEKDVRALHVNEFDIDALIKFAWDFMDSGVGTCVCHVNKDKFRQKVEALIGVCIAENEILTDSERDILNTYNGAIKSVQNCIDKKAELDDKRKGFEIMLKGLPETEVGFKAYIDNQIRMIDEELKSNSERKLQAEATEREVSTQAKQIQMKIKYAGK